MLASVFALASIFCSRWCNILNPILKSIQQSFLRFPSIGIGKSVVALSWVVLGQGTVDWVRLGEVRLG
jgi:hypothetical protein